MRVTHTLTASAICPVDGSKDTYEVIVETRRVIKVEEILAAIESIVKQGAMYQENFTGGLSVLLDAKVTTFGVHSGVSTRVVCKAKR